MSSLKQNLFKLLDRVIETGVPVEIKRKGKILKIVSSGNPDKLSNLKRRDVMAGDPEDIVHIDWSAEWKG